MTVLQKQCLLAYLGYYTGLIDGIWGNQSQQATEAFQRDYQLTVDGIFGDGTAQRIREVIASGEAPAVTNTPDTGTNAGESVTQPPESETSGTQTGTFWDHIRYWSREEFKCRCGEYHAPYCDGYPTEQDQTLVELLDDIRDHFGRPAHRSSGIRCRQHNADQPNSAANSKHLYGKAMDFFIEGVSGEAVRAYAAADPRCNYTYVISGNYVHVDVK